MVKRILLMILSALLFLAAAGCGTSSKSSPAPEVSYPEGVESAMVDVKGKKGNITMLVAVKDKQIVDIRILKNKETPEYAEQALKQIPKRIVEKNSLDVDAVSGATVTSKAILKGTKEALKKLGLDASELQ